MPGRFTVSFFLALCLLSANASLAQYGPGVAGYGSPPGTPYGYSGATLNNADGAVRNWDGTFKYGSPNSPDLQPMLPNYGPGPDGIVTEEIPNAWGFGEETPLDAFLKDVFRESWVRLEYLSWDVKEPGSTLLGAPIQGIDDPTQPFPITYQGALDPTATQETARVFALDTVSLKQRPGIRGTIGVPLVTGSLEASVFALQKTSSSFDDGDLLQGDPRQLMRQFVATSVFLNGTPANATPGLTLFLYDQSFAAAFSTRLFGSELNYVADPAMPGDGFSIRPFGGFRFMEIQERLAQVGVFSDFGSQATITSHIDSDSRNRIYAPQLGLKIELANKWLTFGAEPTVGFGVNQFRSTVSTQSLRAVGDPLTTTTVNSTRFSPYGEFKVYLRVPLNKTFSFFGGWSYMIVAKTNRPHESIFYNDNGAGTPPGIISNPGFSNITYTGWNVGGEIKLP